MKVCGICTSKNRTDIEQALSSGTSQAIVSRRFEFTIWTVHNHYHNHMNSRLLPASIGENRYLQEALDDLQQWDREIRKIYKEGHKILKKIKHTPGTEMKQLFVLDRLNNTIDKALKSIDIAAKRLSEIERSQSHNVVNINILQNPEFIEFKTRIVRFLTRYPNVLEELSGYLQTDNVVPLLAAPTENQSSPN